MNEVNCALQSRCVTISTGSPGIKHMQRVETNILRKKYFINDHPRVEYLTIFVVTTHLLGAVFRWCTLSFWWLCVVCFLLCCVSLGSLCWNFKLIMKNYEELN